MSARVDLCLRECIRRKEQGLFSWSPGFISQKQNKNGYNMAQGLCEGRLNLGRDAEFGCILSDSKGKVSLKKKSILGLLNGSLGILNHKDLGVSGP